MIYVENKKRKLENIQKEYPDADILDLTSKSAYAQKLSPFYPHMNIPVPYSEGVYATCVEAIWQGLKVFENEDVDVRLFSNDTMRNIKRSVRVHGKPLGHRKGVQSDILLNYFDARMLIYLPSYKYVLDNRVHDLIEKIAERAKTHNLVFLDYATNTDVRNISSPLSHAGLVKLYIEGKYPSANDGLQPMTLEEMAEAKNAKKQAKKERKAQNMKLPQSDQPTLF